MNIKFKDGPKFPNLGHRIKPKNAKEVVHPDGKVLYLLDAPSEKAALDTLVITSRFNKSTVDVPYLTYLYCEHIIDFDEADEKMFAMLLDDFNEWWKHIEGKLGTDDQ